MSNGRLLHLGLFFLVIPCFGFTQPLSYSIPLSEAITGGFSPSGQIWVASSHEIMTYRSDTLYARNSLLSYGPLHSADFSNPLKILLFYKASGQIVYLDNTATLLTQPIDLNGLGLEQTTAACLSYDNGLWVFTTDQLRLQRLDAGLNVQVDVPQADRVAGMPGFQPHQMLEAHNRLWLLDTKMGLVVYDVFGGWIFSWHFPGLEKIAMIQEGIAAWHENGQMWTFRKEGRAPEKSALGSPCAKPLAIGVNGVLCSVTKEVIFHPGKGLR